MAVEGAVQYALGIKVLGFNPLTCPCVSGGAALVECVGVKADFVPTALAATRALTSWDWMESFRAGADELLAVSDGVTLST